MLAFRAPLRLQYRIDQGSYDHSPCRANLRPADDSYIHPHHPLPLPINCELSPSPIAVLRIRAIKVEPTVVLSTPCSNLSHSPTLTVLVKLFSSFQHNLNFRCQRWWSRPAHTAVQPVRVKHLYEDAPVGQQRPPRRTSARCCSRSLPLQSNCL